MPSHLSHAGRACIGVGVLGFAALQFGLGEFLPGRAPAWPNELLGKAAFVLTTAVFLLIVAASFLSDCGTRWTGIGAAGLIAGWSLARHVPDA